MKYILRIVFIYLIIFGVMLSAYLTVLQRDKKDLNLTKNELSGIEYLRVLYELSVDVATYKGYLELDEKREIVATSKAKIKSDIEAIYALYEKYPKLKNDSLKELFDALLQEKFSDEHYYEFLDSINLENYRVGDVSELLFEPDRKLYYLNTLITHYLPEYLVSLLITHNVVEEFQHRGEVSSFKNNLYIEQNKLVELSIEEIKVIIEYIHSYEDTKVLKELIDEIEKTLKDLPQNSQEILTLQKESVNLQEYIEVSHKIMDLSHKLNEANMNILESNYVKIQKKLEQNILNVEISFVALMVIITLLFGYFGVVLTANRKKEEELLRINALLDELVVYSKTDKDGVITYASKALLKLSGFSRDELIGKTHRLFRHEDMKTSLYEDMWKTITARKKWSGELKNRRKDGSSYWVEMNILPEFNKRGEISAYIAYREDITYQKEVEKEKLKTQEALEFKSKFLSNMSHEIRTPMNGIIGLLHVALKTELDEHQKMLLNKIKSTSNLLLGVINDILDIAKIESGKMAIEKVPFDLKETIENIVDILATRAQEKSIYFNVEYVGISNFYFQGDALRISQVLTNLLGNAIKFTQSGGITLNVIRKDEKLTFKVQDTGIGLKNESLQNLFEEFTQADMSTSRKFGGTGLGLSISKSLVELMGGQIAVESEYGVGSTFFFTLELEQAEDFTDVKAAEAESLKSLEEEVNLLSNIHILVAEDNQMNQMVLEMLLEDTQLNIEFANDGKIALEKVKANSDYDLILMDIQMPNMNGFEATKAIREFNTEIPIVALSANIMQEDIQNALASGMNDYLAKPIELDKLYVTILKYVV